MVIADLISELSQPAAVGIMPTDTVYGLVARAADKEAVRRLYQLKGRIAKPGTIMAASLEQLEELGLKRRYLKAVSQFWPGPISIVVPLDNDQLGYLSLGQMSLAVRLPNDSKLVKLLQASGPLLTTSANLAGQPVAGTVAEAKVYFKDQVDYYENGGNLSNRLPSTLIRIIDDEIEVLRQGAVKLSSAGRVLK